MLEFKMSGDLQLDRALYAMERKAARNTITKAVRRTLRPITTTVRSRIKNELSTMNAQARAQYSKQIDLSIRVERGGVVGRIRTKRKKVKTQTGMTNFQPLAHLFEGGVAPHQIKQKKRTLSHPGIRKSPIWQDTFDRQRETMNRTYRETLFQILFSEFGRP
jgi:hypothetical protein